MRIALPVVLNPEQRRALERMARQRTLAKRLVERAQIVLRAAEGLDDTSIAEQLRITRKTVSRWRKRFLKGGTAALEKDAPRAGRTRTISERRVKQIVSMTLEQHPDNATHWSTRTMACAAGHQRGQRAAHLARSRTEAPSSENVQTQ